MNRLHSFCADRYRGLNGLVIEDIAPCNLIAGPNGIGKTALIEAIGLFHGRFKPENLWIPSIRRSSRDVVDPIADLGGGDIRLSATEDDGEHNWRAVFEPTIDASAGAGRQITSGKPGRNHPGVQSNAAPGRIAGSIRVWLDDTEAPSTRRQFVSTPKGGVMIPDLDAEREPAIFIAALDVQEVDQETIQDFSNLVIAGKKNLLKADLQIISPMVQDVEVVAVGGGVSYILATTADGERLPLQALGGGMVQLFHILIAMREAAGGMIFLDEIENGLHYSILAEVWTRIRKLAEELDVQVFATTHSLECLDAAIAAFEDNPDDLAVHSLRRRDDDNRIVAASFRGEALQGAREINLEIR